MTNPDPVRPAYVCQRRSTCKLTEELQKWHLGTKAFMWYGIVAAPIGKLRDINSHAANLRCYLFIEAK